jgi:2-oxoglutarate dehydrogenase E1 component
LNAGSAAFVEALYEDYLADPASVPKTWRNYFDSLQDPAASKDESHAAVRKAMLETAGRGAAWAAPVRQSVDGIPDKQSAVLHLIRSYRLRGHLRAKLDPIDLRALQDVPDLDPAFHGLTDADLDTAFDAGSLRGTKRVPLREIIRQLSETYTGHIGAEFMHINELEPRRWIQKRLEAAYGKKNYSKAEKRHILERLTAAKGMERYLHSKYAGQKRFSLEGGESLIPFLDTIIQTAGAQGLREISIGMAHRGRLNVLTNIMGKAPSDLFAAFENRLEPAELTTGDVRYHEGFSANVLTPGGPVHLALAFNPSHLEIINPVVLGSVRCRQDRRNDTDRNEVFGIVVHGDAAMAGQGVVYETLNLSQTRGFSTGGTIHAVVNNRIGFTLSHPRDLHSTLYCTDVGKVVQAPILHVNGDDPEAVTFAAELAVDYRMRFHRDVIIDIICYRRHGHNEADEPAATQPRMYAKIRKHAGVRKLYAQRLVEEGAIDEDVPAKLVRQYREQLDAGRPVAENQTTGESYAYATDWTPYLHTPWDQPIDTSVPLRQLKTLGKRISKLPEGLVLHPRVAKVIDERRNMLAGETPLDWGAAETMAYATLLTDGFGVRLSGQDSGRGTFFHRHAVLHNQTDGESYTPLEHVAPNQPPFRVTDSILSEEAVLGFEFGYACTNPRVLVIWEAQFGDFANVAQVVIDQFISSSEQKWRRLCGLTLLLPHGWEGQGPEHSSARLERFMQLCAQENMQVCNPTTPAQMFHLLRRQMIRPYRKPLVIMSPKSTLRRKASFSNLKELAAGPFKPVIGETENLAKEDVIRIILCSGKVYYDLVEARAARKESRIAIVRMEQLYPFPVDLLKRELKRYPNATEVVWTQEEPMNQGAWDSVDEFIRSCMNGHQSLSYAGRTSSAAPAGGYYQKHAERQKRLLEAAMNLDWVGHHPIKIFSAQEAPLELIRR